MQITEANKINKTVKVVAIILRKKQSCLIANRPKSKIYSSFWEFPGGKVESGESLKGALKRETLEELDIHIKIQDLFLFDNYFIKRGKLLLDLNFFFLGDWFGKISANEGQEIRWIKPQEIKNFKFLNSNIRVLKKLENFFVPHD